MNVIIIEDEQLLSDALKDVIISVDNSITVITQLASIKEAIRYLEQHDFPDLFFADIELSDGLSFEIFKRLNNTVPIIFCTAYNHYALEAFAVHGVDYILKPFDEQSIKISLEKIKTLIKIPTSPTIPIDYVSIITTIENKLQVNRNSILIHQGEKVIPLPISTVALAQLDNGIVYIHTFDKTQHFVNYSMEKLLLLLGNDFYRVNRQFIIHRDNINYASKYFSRKLIIHPKIAFKEDLIVSKANASNFFRWLERP